MVVEESPSSSAVSELVRLDSASACAAPAKAMKTERALLVSREPVVFAFTLTVEPVTEAFLPTTAAVLSVRLMTALACEPPANPPLSVSAEESARCVVVAPTLTLPPAMMVTLLPSTCGDALSPEIESGPVPTNALVLLVPLM